MPANVSHEYVAAEKKFFAAYSDEEKLAALEEMMRTMPKHKGGEAMRKNIRMRYKKLKEKIETEKKRKKATSRKLGIKKAEMQAAIVGLTNSGKSSLLASLTNATPEIASHKFTTQQPNIGTMQFEDTQIQIIDLQAINSEYIDQGLINSADTLLIVITSIKELNDILPFLEKASKKHIIIFNKSEFLNEDEKRKIQATLKSKKYNFVIISCGTKENLYELKQKIWESFDKIRVYTKEPGKSKQETDKKPIILNKDSTVKEVAEKILHGFSEKVKETRITGPSSKFPNQKVSLNHVLMDKDVVEFYTR